MDRESRGFGSSRNFISAWNGSAVLPTLKSGWNWISSGYVPSLSLVSGWTDVKLEGIRIPSSATNIAVFVWKDGVVSGANALIVQDAILISQIQLVTGDKVKDFIPKTSSHELLDCQRYFYSLGNDVDYSGTSIKMFGSQTQSILITTPYETNITSFPKNENYTHIFKSLELYKFWNGIRLLQIQHSQ